MPAAFLAVFTLVVACTSGSQAPPAELHGKSVLEVTVSGFSADAQGFVRPGEPWVAGLVAFCVNPGYSGDVKVLRVWATKPRGLRLVAWGIRHVTPQSGFGHTPVTAQTTLANLGHYDKGPIRSRCGAREHYKFDDLGIQLVRLPGYAVATTGWLAVEYVNRDGTHSKLALPVKTALCAKSCPDYVKNTP